MAKVIFHPEAQQDYESGIEFMTARITINSLEIPKALEDALRLGYWITPKNSDLCRSLFSSDEIVKPWLYDLNEMRRQNANWVHESRPAYLGESIQGEPGNVDPKLSIIIGGLGPDRLIALDFADDKSHPSVVALSGDDSTWKRVAVDIEQFIEILRLRAAS